MGLLEEEHPGLLQQACNEVLLPSRGGSVGVRQPTYVPRRHFDASVGMVNLSGLADLPERGVATETLPRCASWLGGAPQLGPEGRRGADALVPPPRSMVKMPCALLPLSRTGRGEECGELWAP